MNPILIFKNTPRVVWYIGIYLAWGEGAPVPVPVLAGAIKSWLSYQLEGSEVKLILSETGWHWASWRGGVRGAVTCDCYDGPGRRGSLQCTKKKKTSGDKRWVRVTSQFCHHLMLFSETSNRKSRGERIKRLPMGAVVLGTLYLNDSNVIQRDLKIHQWKLKINFKKREAPRRVTDIT